jgi:hypothetical protein
MPVLSIASRKTGMLPMMGLLVIVGLIGCSPQESPSSPLSNDPPGHQHRSSRSRLPISSGQHYHLSGNTRATPLSCCFCPPHSASKDLSLSCGYWPALLPHLSPEWDGAQPDDALSDRLPLLGHASRGNTYGYPCLQPTTCAPAPPLFPATSCLARTAALTSGRNRNSHERTVTCVEKKTQELKRDGGADDETGIAR